MDQPANQPYGSTSKEMGRFEKVLEKSKKTNPHPSQKKPIECRKRVAEEQSLSSQTTNPTTQTNTTIGAERRNSTRPSCASR
jgi:hypothetical protein